VDRLVSTLFTLHEVQRISLFGSYARGRHDLFTDLDVLVILETAKPFVERLSALYSLLSVPVDLDLLCYKPEEWADIRTRPFFKNLLADEVVLYEKNRPLLCPHEVSKQPAGQHPLESVHAGCGGWGGPACPGNR
jgi:predicted nucleotidyltransferase